MTTTTVRAETGPDRPPNLWQSLWQHRTVKVLAFIVGLGILFVIGSMFTSNDEDPPGAARPDAAAPVGPALTTQIIPPLPGATGISGVVPVGYPQTEAGAVAAATNYLTVLYGSPDMLTEDTRNPIIAAAVAPDSQAQVSTELGGINDQVADIYGLDEDGTTAGGGNIVVMLTPKSYRLDGYAPERAVVSIWHDVVVGVTGEASTMPPSARYTTAIVTLTWANGDWKWRSLDGYDGPTPSGAGDTGGADPTALTQVITEWTRYTYGAGGTP